MDAKNLSKDHEEQSSGSLNVKKQSSSVNEPDSICFAIFRHNKQNSTIKNIILLKQLFCRCLPRMSKHHILQTILSEDHINLIMIRDKSQLIGAITFRLFQKNQFIQIVFLAIQGKYQRKGFGTQLINTLKNEMRKIRIKNLLTYADNLAHAFFYRQGFTSKVTLQNSQFQGLIKKYEGGTLMHCVIQQKKIPLPKMDIIKQQQSTNILKQEKIIQEKQQQSMIKNQNQKQQKSLIEQKLIQEKQLPSQKKVKKQIIVGNSKKQKKKNHTNNSSIEPMNSLMRWIRKSEPIKNEKPTNQ